MHLRMALPPGQRHFQFRPDPYL